MTRGRGTIPVGAGERAVPSGAVTCSPSTSTVAVVPLLLKDAPRLAAERATVKLPSRWSVNLGLSRDCCCRVDPAFLAGTRAAPLLMLEVRDVTSCPAPAPPLASDLVLSPPVWRESERTDASDRSDLLRAGTAVVIAPAVNRFNKGCCAALGAAARRARGATEADRWARGGPGN